MPEPGWLTRRTAIIEDQVRRYNECLGGTNQEEPAVSEKPLYAENPDFREYIHLLADMHILIVTGQKVSDESDRVIARMRQLDVSLEEKKRALYLSDALYDVLDGPSKRLEGPMQAARTGSRILRAMLDEAGVWTGRLPDAVFSGDLLDCAFAVLCEEQIAKRIDLERQEKLAVCAEIGRDVWRQVGEAVLGPWEVRGSDG